MPTKSRRCYAFAVLVLPLAFGGLPVQAHALPPGPLRGPPAAAATSDVVNLKNGGMVLGQIVEILPDDSLTVVSTAGDRKRFGWAELASYERDGVRTEVPTTPAVAPVPYVRPETVQAGPGAPRLHIELTRPADLKLYEVTGEFSGFNYRGFSSGTTSAPVCAAPCDRVIDGRRGQSLFFNGDHVLKSRKFSLTEHSGDVVARVKPGRPARRVGGIIGLALGGAGLGTAAFLYWTAKRHADWENENREDMAPRFEPNYRPATALLITGAIVAAGGLALLLLSGTRVKWSKRTAAARRRLGLI